MAGPVSAQDDPFAPNDPDAKPMEPTTIRAVYEVFSLPMTEAAAIQRSGLSDGKFYEKMLEGIKNETMKQEVFMVARFMPGSQVIAQEGGEHIHAMEFNPAGLSSIVASPGKSDSSEKSKKAMDVFPVTPASPLSFKTKAVGRSIELEAGIDQEGKVIELRLAASEVSLIQRDRFGQGVSMVEMPRFAVPSLRTGVAVLSGRPSYLGTISPPVELQPKEGESRVWFAFITASKVKL